MLLWFLNSKHSIAETILVAYVLTHSVLGLHHQFLQLVKTAI